MNKALLVTLLYTCAIAALPAQDRSFGTLSMAGKRGGAPSARPNMERSPKYQRAAKIFNDLVNARGDFRYTVPTFVFNDDTSAVAEISYGAAVSIRLEERAYDVCASFGPGTDAAIAFLLAHELTHYYERHAWRIGFTKEYKQKRLQIGVQLDTLVDDIANETQADYLGGFLAYSAGYGLFDRGPDLIQKLYEAYYFVKKDPLPNYPSLHDRKALTQYSAEKMKDLADLFDMANLLTATGNFSDALVYYRFILNDYQSREIYNNIGVTAMKAVLVNCREYEKFLYPLELDLNSSAGQKSGFAGGIDSALVRQALLQFDAAISLDPGYAPAYLNKACAYAVLGDYVRARFYAEEEARSRAREKDKTGQLKYPETGKDVDLLLGIVQAKTGNKDKAKELFQTALNAGRNLGEYNLKVLSREEPLPADPGGSKKAVLETIDNQTAGDVAENRKYDKNKTIKLLNGLFFRRNPNVFINENPKKGFTTFQMSPPDYKGKTGLGIGLGDTFATITDSQKGYGTPASIISTPQGQMLVYTNAYNEKNIIFILGNDGKLKRWVNYSLPDTE